LNSGEGITIWTDNTNCEYNLNRRKAGWRMHAGIKEILSFLKERKIRLHCKHTAGEGNKMADSLSRLCPGGQYLLKGGVLNRVEKALGIVTEVDLFANRRNTQKKTYWTLEKDTKAEGRNA
jgi:hypothetical protein